MKTCSKCGETKPLGEFCRNGRGSRRCRDCVAEYNRHRYAAQREKIAEMIRQDREADLEKVREQDRRSQAAKREKIAERSRQWRAANLEKVREKERRYRQANREKIAERKRRYEAANREKIRERVREAPDPEKRRASAARYRAKVKAAVFAHYGTACACCGSADHLQIDHVNGDGKQHRMELAAIGSDLYTWLRRNGFPGGFQTLCRPCNSSKKDGDRCWIPHAGLQEAWQ